MPYLYKQEEKSHNNLISATKPRDAQLDLHSKTQSGLQTRLKLKKQIIIYTDGKKYFVDHATAYALKLIQTRAVMLDKPKLVEISAGLYSQLNNQDDIEVILKIVEKDKPKLQVFVHENSKAIEIGAAYALGLMSVEEFNKADSRYYYIDEALLKKLQNDYNIEYGSIVLHEEVEKNRK